MQGAAQEQGPLPTKSSILILKLRLPETTISSLSGMGFFLDKGNTCRDVFDAYSTANRTLELNVQAGVIHGQGTCRGKRQQHIFLNHDNFSVSLPSSQMKPTRRFHALYDRIYTGPIYCGGPGMK
jgi:hypothetical protein